MILEYKVMPEDVDTNLNKIKEELKNIVKDFEGTINNIKEIPIGFGLKAISINLSLDEKKGTEGIENKFREIPNVQGIELITMSRALG